MSTTTPSPTLASTIDQAVLATLRTAGAFCAKLRSNRLPVSAMQQWARLYSLKGAAVGPMPNSEESWLPVGLIGSVLAVGHYKISELSHLPFPRELIQPVIIPEANYRALFDEYYANADFLAKILREMPAKVYSGPKDWSPADGYKPGTPDEKKRLIWLKAMGLISEYDAGSVESILEEKLFSVEKLSPDLVLAIRHVTTGIPLAKRDLFAFEFKPISTALSSAACDRGGFFPFASDDAYVAILTANLKDTGPDDQISSDRGLRTYKVLTSRDTLVGLFQGLSAGTAATPTGQDQGAHLMSSKVDITIQAEDLERFNPRLQEDGILTSHWILYEGAKCGASDIHIEIQGEQMVVRVGVDGSGREILRVGKKRMQQVSQLYKQAAGIKADGIRPGEGQFVVRVGQRDMDVRASLLIVRETEAKWTLRLIDKSIGVLSVSHLGLPKEDLDVLRRAYHHPHGLFIVSGPTGHGKSTTNYAILRDLATPERFIYTIEDPIEQEISGISQIRVSKDPEQIAKGAFSFASALEHILRAAPHVIMVGEIRDPKTGHVSVDASATGHLVFATIHANDTLTILIRLRDFGVNSVQLSRALVGVISQRLVRKLCPACHSYSAPSDEQKRIFECCDVTAPQFIHTPVGCEQCGYTGYKRRVVVMEFLPLTNEIRAAIETNADDTTLRRIAKAAGYRNLFQKGIGLVAKGITSFEEIAKVCPAD